MTKFSHVNVNNAISVPITKGTGNILCQVELSPGVYIIETAAELLNSSYSGSAVLRFKDNNTLVFDQSNSVCASFINRESPVMSKTFVSKVESKKTLYLSLQYDGSDTESANGIIRYVQLFSLG